MKRLKLLYFVTEDWYFVSHRLPLARAAQEAGYDTSVVTNVNEYCDAIHKTGIKVIPLNISRRSKNPLSELLVIFRLALLYKKEKPDIVHQVGIKPVIYGSLAAKFAGVPNVVNALAGMGYVFTSKQIMARLLRPIFGAAFKILLDNPNSRLILQNQNDRAMFIQKRLVHEKYIRLVRGSGVDPAVFFQKPEPAGIPVVILASRMLWDKGIREFVEAANRLKSRGEVARFLLVGDTDIHNPSSIPREQLIAWHKEGVIEWMGWRDDMPFMLSQSHVVCLPSYREGLPKVLLEAASCGRPIVASNVPGCIEIVRHNDNGLLVPPRDSTALADAIKILINNPELRAKMGSRGQKIVENEFSEKLVIKQTLKIYQEMLERKRE